jgi:hypothetical protein
MLNASGKKKDILPAFHIPAFLKPGAMCQCKKKRQERDREKEDASQEHFARVLGVALAWTVWAFEPVALPKTLQ